MWVVAGVGMAALVLGVVAIGRWAVPDRREDLWVELAKAAIQLVVVIGLGGIVSVVLKTVEVSREQRRIRDERRFAVFRDLVNAYHQLKSVRRNLRMAGLRGGPDELRPEQVEALRAGMASLVEVELTLEQVHRELDARSVFDWADEIRRHLQRLMTYVSKLISEWERNGGGFWPDRQTGRLQDLPALQAFLGVAKADFRPNAADPMGRMEWIVRSELEGQKIDKADLAKAATPTGVPPTPARAKTESRPA
jgi:hypothetical protein